MDVVSWIILALVCVILLFLLEIYRRLLKHMNSTGDLVEEAPPIDLRPESSFIVEQAKKLS